MKLVESFKICKILSQRAWHRVMQTEMADARRSYADRETIDGYTQQLNELVSATITCKGVNQEIPMRLVTAKFGVDWWAMPSFNFADENGYVAFTELLDAQSVQYGINFSYCLRNVT